MSSSNSNMPSPVRERRRTLIACMNCRSRKLKVSKPPSKVSYPCSHYYYSVVHSSRLKVPLVRDVLKKELSVNIAPSTQQPPTILLIIKTAPLSAFTMFLPLLCQTKTPLCPLTNPHTYLTRGGMYPIKYSTRPLACRHLSSRRTPQRLHSSIRRIM